jgi:hypothetical protein
VNALHQIQQVLAHPHQHKPNNKPLIYIMKIYMSYWSGGYQKLPSEYVVDLHKLSAFYALKHYGEITLITDSKSKSLFEDAPFTNITTDLDIFDGVTNKNWALGKLYAYKLLAQAREPFIHIDYDVFLMKPIAKEYENKSLLIQSLETDAFNHYQLEKFYSNIGENTEFESPNSKHIAYNMGIFGGTEYEFIEYYAQSALDFSLNPKNQKTFDVMHDYRSWAPATITEQYYLWLLAKKNNIQVTSYLDGDDSSENAKEILEADAEKKGYVHLLAAKNYSSVKKRVYETLAEFAKKEKTNV